MSRPSPPATDRYFEDFAVGDAFVGNSLAVTEEAIVEFARLYDPQPFHLDPAAAKDGPFGGLVASGIQTLGLGFRLFYETGVLRHASLGGPGMDELRWPRPVRPGDTLRSHAVVRELIASRSRPDRGVMKLAIAVLNQNEETVMTAVLTIFVKRRGPAAGNS